jgi:hypothetical protein
LRPVGAVKPKGFEAEVRVFELLGIRSAANAYDAAGMKA